MKLKKLSLIALSLLTVGCTGDAKTISIPPLPPIEPELKMVCEGCSYNEQTTVDFLFDRGIVEPRAMSVVLGNIKQESLFKPNICEGGARVPYEKCHRGGYGLIQWTTTARYDGLGHFAASYGGNPSELKTQLRYMVNEKQWTDIEPYFIKGGLSSKQYMGLAYDWLGWGVMGKRGIYADQYLDRLKIV